MPATGLGILTTATTGSPERGSLRLSRDFYGRRASETAAAQAEIDELGKRLNFSKPEIAKVRFAGADREIPLILQE